MMVFQRTKATIVRLARVEKCKCGGVLQIDAKFKQVLVPWHKLPAERLLAEAVPQANLPNARHRQDFRTF